MNVRLTAVVFIIAAGAAAAGPLDLCDHVESRQKEIINLFKCIMARASAELQDQLKELKPKLYCTDYYIVVKKVCRLKPFAAFMREYLSTPALYSEMENLAEQCQKRGAPAHSRPVQKQETEAPGLWQRITKYLKKLAVMAADMMRGIVRRFTSNNTASI
ncbi:uncharacterized protein LOC144114865 isoform X2 [Amblyomma americanum]